MPKEHKKRGRRGEQKKRKLEEDEAGSPDTKRARHATTTDADADTTTHAPQDTIEAEQQQEYEANAVQDAGRPPDMPFYGMLDEEEQEYFRRADDMLELNQFANADERVLFLDNVWKEAEGKELKLANSQSCSRLMERLILLSTPAQLKNLFQKFNGQ